MGDSDALESELLHRFKNQLALGMGFCNLLIEDFDEGDARRGDLLQIQRAIQEAIDLLPELAKQMK